MSEASRQLSLHRRKPLQDTLNSVLIDSAGYPDKCTELYETTKHLTSLKHMTIEKTTYELEFEKSKGECTFQPKISQQPSKQLPVK